MSTLINTNLASIYARNNLNGAQNALATSVERLSSGLRINRAKDDAAGLGISQSLKSQIASISQSVRNANDAVSVIQTAEGSLAQVSEMLLRMKELAAQRVNGTLGSEEEAIIDAEFQDLEDEIQAVAGRTLFNGIELLGGASTLTWQTGTATSNTFELDFGTFDLTTDADITGTTATDADTIDTAIATIAEWRSTLGSSQNRLEYTIANLQAHYENMVAANSRIEDTDYAAETANLTKTQIMQQAATAMLAQANQMPNVILALLQ